MKTQHTRGEWIVKEWEKEGTDFFHIRSEQKFTDLIATVYRWKGHIDKRESLANAKLIAVSPLLLTEAQKLIDNIKDYFSDVEDVNSIIPINALCEAIKKATE